MRKIPVFAATLALAAGAALAMTLPAGASVTAASPPDSVIQVQSPGLLQARGVAVTVPVLLVCAPDQTGGVSVNLTERVGNDLATGSGYTQVSCTGEAQTVDVTVVANQVAFRNGPAYAQGYASLCGYLGCVTVPDSRTIDLAKKD